MRIRISGIFLISVLCSTFGYGQVYYGTTRQGGSTGAGTIYKYDYATGVLTTDHEFVIDGLAANNADYCQLLKLPSGKMYGVTPNGGAKDQGVLYEYDPSTNVFLKKVDFDISSTGANPYGSLALGADGKIYGTCYTGGNAGAGTIFQYDASTGTIALEYQFLGGANGYSTFAGLALANNSKLYGTTFAGGANGLGILFEYDPATNVFTKKVDFNGAANGAQPLRSLTKAASGKLYGLTFGGGASDKGVLFEFDPSTSAFAKKVEFDGTTKGAGPVGNLLLASSGKMYSTTSSGGLLNLGTLFEFDPSTGVFTNKHDFADAILEGSAAGPSLVQITNGKIYGTTESGGANGDGTLFEYDPATNAFVKKVDFAYYGKGAQPKGGLTLAANGKLYGTVASGAQFKNGGMFEYAPSTNTYALKLSFNGASNGANPVSAMTRATNGKLYGTTKYGGTDGWGIIYEYDPVAKSVIKKTDFNDLAVTGYFPEGSLTLANDGKLYGVAGGGTNFDGIIYQYNYVANTFTNVVNFDAVPNGSNPFQGLTLGADGKLYGVTIDGGANGLGVLFAFDPATNGFEKKIDFDGTLKGTQPNGLPTLANNGKFYGVTESGGANGLGVLYEFDPTTSAFVKRFDFNGTANGSYPLGQLALASNGKLYGTTQNGGANNVGVLFSYDPSLNTISKILDFGGLISGAIPQGDLYLVPGDDVLLGTTASGGTSDRGVFFEYDITLNAYAPKNNFTYGNGSSPSGRLVSYTTLATEPTQPPTGLIFTGVTSTGFNYNFTDATGSHDGYLHLRKDGSAPTFIPVDGVTYSVDDVLPDGSVIQYNDNVATGNQSTGLIAGTTYHYAIYVYTGSGNTTNYLNTTPLRGSVTTSGGSLAAEPTSSPSGLLFSNITGTGYDYSFTDASPVPDGYIHVRKAGSAPTDVPQDGVTYAALDGLGTSTIMFVGSGSSFTQGSAVAGTTYFYAIYAYNGTGTSINYRITNPATGSITPTNLAAEPTAQPTALNFTNIGITTFDLSFTSATGSPAGYIGIANSSGSPAAPVDGVTYTSGDAVGSGGSFVSFVGTGTSYNVTGADPATTLNYAVYSYNGSGSAINYLQTSPLTKSVTTLSDEDTTPPSLKANSTALKVAPGQTLKVTTSWEDLESGVVSVLISYGPTNERDWTATDVDLVNTTGTTWEFTIPASAIGELGAEYRLIAYNGTGLSKETDLFRVVVEHTGNGLSIPYSSFGSDISAYRILSIPLELEKKSINEIFSDDLGAYDPKSWRMFRYQSGKYSELTGTSALDLGRGYMFIAKKGATTSLDTGPGVTADYGFDKPFTFTPSNGWNLIGNPFNYEVDWTDVQDANAALTGVDLKTFNGTQFSKNGKLQPFSGGFIFLNSTAPITIPHITSGRRAENKPEFSQSIDQNEWWVDLKLKADDRETIGGFGMSNSASAEYDRKDDFTIPRFMEYLELNHSKSLFGSAYTKDVVPVDSHHEWSFEVETNLPAKTITLEWENSYFGLNDRQLVLWDEARQRAVNMKTQTSYSFNKGDASGFKVFFGSEAYVKEMTRPNRALIHTVYPVPADLKVTFGFSVPESGSTTSLDVYDLLGKKIATLVDEPLTGGYHEVVWSIDQGQKPLPGLYISVLKNGHSVAQEKLIIK